MIFKNKKSQKFISVILIFSILLPTVLFSVPKQANAQTATVTPVSDVLRGIWDGIKTTFAKIGSAADISQASLATKTWYEKILAFTLMAIARRALQEITKGIVGWINSGFHGSPLFLENSSSFFEDIVKSEIKKTVDMYGYDSVRFPYGKDFAINTINAYRSKLEDNAAYSLSKVMTDPAQLYNYQNNFNVGGWNAFLINTQYPQNNYLGFQMMASEQLAGKVTSSPNANNAISKVKETLQQGMGFLSPQTCPSNPGLSPQTSPYNPPLFPEAEYEREHSIAKECPYTLGNEEHDQCVNLWKAKKVEAKREFKIANDCPGGWVDTTPGSVVAGQITKALNIPMDSTLQAMGLGNSLSAIFDALLNKFLSPDGLLGLASSKNTKPADDGWSYDGLTLGSPTDSNNSSWDSGPDEEIILEKFKKQLHGKTIVPTTIDGAPTTIEEIGNTNTAQITRGTYIPGDIANLEIELILMDQTLKQLPGISQLAQTLDQCTPGPDKAWENRLKNEQERMAAKLQKEGSGDDDLKTKAANDAVRELKFAVDSFKDWITIKMIGELPGEILFVDAIQKSDDFPQQLEELKKTKRTKDQTLARLKAIAGDEKALTKTGLAKLTIQPEPDSAEEKVLILLKKQYNALKSSISSSTSIENTRTELDTLKDHSSNLQSLITQCNTERVAAGWDAIGGRESKQGGFMEVQKFCSIPIVSGYSHGEIIREDSSNEGEEFTFRNPNGNDLGNDGFQDLPIVNAKNVYGDITCTGAGSWLPGGCGGHGGSALPGLGETDKRQSIEIDCNTVFKANKTDYTHAGESTF